jgi:hypothetical protein
MVKLGYVDGHYYTHYVEEIRQLKREKQYDRAISLLSRIVVAAENESNTKSWAVPPWYYEQLAIIYREQKEPGKEATILKRYVEFQTNLGLSPKESLVKRLEKMEVA